MDVANHPPDFSPLNRFSRPVVPLARMETDGTRSLARGPQLADQRALIERARKGDPSAHRALYETNVDQIFRLTFRLTGEERVARELTQDTFVRAFASIQDFREESAFSTWLHRIAVSVSLNEIKRLKRERRREAPFEEAIAMSRTAPLSDPVLRDRLAAAVAELPEGCRAVFMMHDSEGYTHDEIAAALGVTAGTSKAQLSRARAKLRLALAEFDKEWRS